MSKTILMIDDDEVERTVVRRIVEQEPTWELVEARDGQEALDRLCDGLRPELCLVDLVMPRIGGIELLRRIRRDPELRGLRAMIASSTRDRDTIVELAQLRIEDYVLKPYDSARTLASLHRVLDPLPDPAEADPGTRNLFAKTVLVVDDDPVSRKALTRIISRDRLWEIVEAADGATALEKLRAGLKPELCLLDLNMPGLDGGSLLAALRADPALAALRIAVISADQDREQIRALAKLRIEAYLLKPFNALKVQAVLNAAAPV